MLDAIAEGGQPRRKDHLPHLGMHVMQKDHSGRATPQRREERHAIPDLDHAITGADLGAHARECGAGEDGVTAGPTVDGVAITVDLPGRTIDARCPFAHVDARVRPSPQHFVRVKLRPSRLGVLEIPPGHHVDSANAGHLGQGHQAGPSG